MNGKKYQKLQSHEIMCIKIIRWIIFGVTVSLLPFLFVLFRYWLSDFSTGELDYLLDLLLITIAISANAVNLICDSEKKISIVIKAISVAILAIIIYYCASTYAALFEQTILNNKLLKEYNDLTVSLQAVSSDFANRSDYESIMQRLEGIKLIIDETCPKPDKLESLRWFSIVSLVLITLFGVVIEYLDKPQETKRLRIPGRY